MTRVLVGDVSGNYCNIGEVVKSEIVNVLQNFFVIRDDLVSFDISADSFGKIIVQFKCETMGVKKVSKIN